MNLQSEDILKQIQLQKLLVVNPRRKNGLIVYKKYHAEFVGPGAVVGGQFDANAVAVIPVGKLSLIVPETSEQRRQAYKMRRQWVKLTKQITDNPNPNERARVILNQFEHWFDTSTVVGLPDEAFALLVGVLPQTIHQVRYSEMF